MFLCIAQVAQGTCNSVMMSDGKCINADLHIGEQRPEWPPPIETKENSDAEA